MNGQKESAAIPPSLLKYIATRDARVTKVAPWRKAPLLELFHRLLTHGAVTHGGRSTCGTSVDHTWTEFTAFGEIIRKAQKMGYAITVTRIKQSGSWATKAGGWWHENEYTLDKVSA